MQISLTRELETLFFILLASALGLFAVFYMRQPHHMNSVQVISSIPNFIAQNLTPTPTPQVTPPPPVTTSWNSSDGTEKLTMQTTLGSTTKSFTFTVTNSSTNSTTPLFSTSLPLSSNMSIPFNAFSPDNAYLFLKETAADGTHFLVFKTSGVAFTNGDTFIDISPLFATHLSQYTLVDVTGWASPTLLVVNTKKSDGSTGPSFWFDVTTRGFIQLSTLFE